MPQRCFPYVTFLDRQVPDLKFTNTLAANETPRDANHFRDICAKIGKEARCAVVPIVSVSNETPVDQSLIPFK